MGAVLMRARAELRAQARTWIALAVLVGLVAGLVIAAAAGARRTDTVYQRFLEAQRAADVLVDNYPDPGVETVDPGAVERLPQVESAARASYTFLGTTPNFSGALAPADARLGREIHRLKVLEGRRPDPERIEEIVVGFERARQFGWELGTTIPLIPREFRSEAARFGIENVNFRVVGLIAAPGEFPPLERGGPSVVHSRAFYRAYAGTPVLDFDEGAGAAVLARLEHGEADVPAFRRELRRLAGGEPVQVSAQTEHAADVERSFELQVAALWLFAAVLGLTGITILAQALARQAFLEAGEYATLRALGMSRAQLWAIGLVRAAATGLLGAALAVGVAVALSPLFPVGSLGRAAEPDPGITLDGRVIGVGALATVLLTVVLALHPAWTAAPGRPARRPAPGAESRLAGALARAGASRPVLMGVRMALESGGGRDPVPVRTAIVGVSVGIMAFAASLTFGASSSHLLDTPRLYGWDWDLAVTNDGGRPDLAGRASAAFTTDSAIEEAAVADAGSLEIGGRNVDALGVERLRGSVLPPVIEGRAPTGRGEILLGARTMRELDLEIGDSVMVRRGARGARMRVVGQTVLPPIVTSASRLGEGAVLAYRDVRRLEPDEQAGVALLRVSPGADRDALVRRLGERLDAFIYAPPMEQPLEIVDFGQVRELPLVLSGVLGALAAATLAHVLVSAVRRRRHDLAVLKALGFTRGELRTVVRAHSLSYAAAGLLAGLPLGIALGRLGWNLFAEWQGIAPEVVVPVIWLVLAVPLTVTVAAALAVLPARSAAATRPALTLRAE